MNYRMAKHVMSKEEMAIALNCLERAKFSRERPVCLVGIHYPEPRVTHMNLPHAEHFNGEPFAYRFNTVKLAFGEENYPPIKGATCDAIVCGDLIMQMKLT